MTRLRRLDRDDAGESLLELVVTIAIVGVCVVAIGAGMALSIKMSSIHRAQSTADAFLHNYAETLQGQYTACTAGSVPNYAAGLAPPSTDGLNAPTATVTYWNATTLSWGTGTSCPGTGDPGLQRVALSVASADGFVSESLVVILRKST
jgi:type II secretory pathway pseudopilin PulG